VSPCPCSRCRGARGPLAGITAILGAGLTSEDRARGAADSYVRGYIDVEQLEERLDDVFGITHARHARLERERRARKRARRRRWLAV
jgi:hypothetical protein